MTVFIVVLLLCAFIIGQAFRGYRLRHFYRIFPGFFSGLLISYATGYLCFMDGTMGDVARFLMRSEFGRRLGIMIDGGNLFGALQELMKNEAARDLLLRVLPDSVKTFAVISALVCIVCAVVSAVWEKPGVFLELFAYGYTLTAGILASMESALWGGAARGGSAYAQKPVGRVDGESESGRGAACGIRAGESAPRRRAEVLPQVRP